MNELGFATAAAFIAFVSWEILCYTQLRITKHRNRKLHNRIHGH
ncbi:hypothetical protein ACFL96_07915 [Thermoproteota archaeon]